MLHHPKTIRSRGYLPHWETPGATYSVTFRLADSLPQSILESYARERQSIIETAHQMNRPLSPQELVRMSDLFSEKIEYYLDQGAGECHLRNPAIAKMIFDALSHFHPERYELFTWCIMPNHVHALLRPNPSHGLDDILQSWKSFTAKEANRILSRTGTFWMPEYFDHMIRDAADFAHAHNYFLNNPQKAGLDNWPWVATLLTNKSGQDARVT